MNFQIGGKDYVKMKKAIFHCLMGAKKKPTKPRAGINRLLIANRGEIALRIHRSAKELGISTIGIFSEDDSHALHLSHVNESISLGAAGPNAYLDMANLIKIALANKCDAIHPGYGFLSENHKFASKVNSAGLIFIGPTENQLKLFGDKISALRHAEKLDIPVLGISEELENYKSLEVFVHQHLRGL